MRAGAYWYVGTRKLFLAETTQTKEKKSVSRTIRLASFTSTYFKANLKKKNQKNPVLPTEAVAYIQKRQSNISVP